MGKRPRRKPSRLAEKLLLIRTSFGLSQTQMWKQLGIDDYLPYTVISGYERGLREPSLQVVLLYARLAGLPMEMLVDDELDLPEKIPSNKRPLVEDRKPGRPPEAKAETTSTKKRNVKK